METAPLGVSIVVCCYNSASRLPRTLAHLRDQKVSGAVPWEVIVVDNASTDDTAAVARSCWRNAAAPLRVIHEPRPGQKFARERGVAEARYEFISFADDDNWLADDWVDVAAGFLAEHPEVGAVGGSSTLAADIAAPRWFPSCQVLYAISPEKWIAGERVPDNAPWGAGLTIRKSAWRDVHSTGSPFLTSGRLGASLAAGEDNELCYRLSLANWKLWYEPRLRFQHYMPEQRLTLEYARRLCRGAGQAGAVLAPYDDIVASRPSGSGFLGETWEWKLLRTVQQLAWHFFKLLRGVLSETKRETAILELEMIYGKLSILARSRSKYYEGRQQVRELSARLKSRRSADDSPAAAGANSPEDAETPLAKLSMEEIQ